MQTPLSLTETPATDGLVRIVAVGELDAASAPLLERRTAQVARRTRTSRLLIDLGDVTFLDAAGMSALGACYREALRWETDFHITAARGVVRRVLDIAGLWQWLSDQP